MDKQGRIYRFSLIAAVLVAFFLISSSEWFNYTMPRHQTIQLPAMFILGLILAMAFPKAKIKDLGLAISGLIIILSSIIFWMLPHSVDLAVIDPTINRAMHINMVLCGFLLVAIYRAAIFELKIFFFAFLSAKLAAVGIVMRVFDILLCSSFDIRQQKATGYNFIMIGTVLFVATLVIFLRKPTVDRKKEALV